MKAYVANGLFSESDRDYNIKLVTRLRAEFPEVEFYLPQENLLINDKSTLASSIDIAIADMTELRASDFIIAVIDGVEIDSGVAAEIGASHMLNIPIFGLCTDIRFNNDDMENKMTLINLDPLENPIMYRNLFVTGLIRLTHGTISGSIDELINNIDSKIPGVKHEGKKLKTY